MTYADDATTVLVKLSSLHRWTVLDRYDTRREAEAAARKLARKRPRGAFFPLYATLGTYSTNYDGRVY